jgi:hypothetical protein
MSKEITISPYAAQKIKAYLELIDITSRQIANLLMDGLREDTKAQADIGTMFVDDDDNIHVVITNHKNARQIAARVEIIKELKAANKA